MLAVRVRFKKYGRARYISHLDLNRCMSRAIKRAGLPVWHTQGFNPHPYITFALPLSIFSESDCEVMDTRFDAEMDFETARQLLNAQMPDGIEIYSVTEPVMRVVDIAWAAYEIRLEYNLEAGAAEQRLKGYLEDVMHQPELIIEKQTKRHTLEINVRDYFDKAQIRVQGNMLIIQALLPASTQENLNPSCFAAAIAKYAGIVPLIDSVRRTAIYNDRMQPFI